MARKSRFRHSLYAWWSFLNRPPQNRTCRPRYPHARERLKELHAVNNRQQRERRQKPEKIVVSVSDPEAALGRDKYNVFRPLYNMQMEPPSPVSYR
jgi:hypothetical protein